MSYDALAVKVRNLSKNYLLFEKPEDRLKQMIIPKMRKAAFLETKNYYEEYAAVNNISFNVFKGETIGIIGRNGSGKSTLLQMICGTLTPSLGQVEVNGRIAALLELGAGFNPEFSGRENVYLNAAILGLSKKETDERFESITNFADIGIFIDQPVKTYSSGMYIRLAFAVAINVDPDILVIDEALAVGDESFQRKCFARIEEIKKIGATIIFVSHSAQSIIQLCDRALFLDRGEFLLEGDPKLVIGQYQKFGNLTGEQSLKYREKIKDLDFHDNIVSDDISEINQEVEEVDSVENELVEKDNDSWFDTTLVSKSSVVYDPHYGEITNYQITNDCGQPVNNLYSGNEYFVEFTVTFFEDASNIICGMLIKTLNGIELCGVNTEKKSDNRIGSAKKGDAFKIRISFVNRLTAGTYILNMGVMGQVQDDYIFIHRILDGVMIRVHESTQTYSSGYFDLGSSIEQTIES